MKANPKRLGIFVVYDSEGIVDDYIPYLLEDMCQNLEHLVIVCNGFVNEKGLQKLKKFTDDVFVRENIEYDGGAIKDVLYNLYGWENVYKFDELVLFNDSFFGPFYPFKTIFDKMDKQEVDFWGLNEQHEFAKDFPAEDEKFPVHLQSFFIVIKESLLKTEDYKSFWETMPFLSTFYNTIVFYETRMMPYFVEKGYTRGFFTEFSELTSQGVQNNYVYTYDTPFEVICECAYPILKRKALVRENNFTLKGSNSEGYAQLMDYIDKQLDYDVNLIWDNILRVYDIADLRCTMHLDKVLPSRARNATNNALAGSRIAIIVQVSNPVLSGNVQEYLKRIPCDAGIDIITDKTKMQKDALRDYDYICFIQDIAFKDSTPVTVMRSAMLAVLENMIKSPQYIENIINEFEDNPRLGLLTPPHPLHSKYFSTYGGAWGEDFCEAQQFAQTLGLRKLSLLRRPFVSESAFWCRTNALKCLQNRDILLGFSTAEMKALPYVAQKEGYYSAVTMSDSYAALQSTNCEYLLAEINDSQKRQPDFIFKEFGFNEFFAWYLFSNMVEFCKRYERIYIYGDGDMASRCAKFLLKLDISFVKFVVSDGRTKLQELLGYDVCYLSELESPNEKVGIVLGMNKSNIVQVFPSLQQKGYNNLFVVS